MRHTKRLDRLADRLRATASDRARRVRYSSCLGLDDDELIDALVHTITEDTVGLFEELMGQVSHYAKRGRSNPDGTRDLHGFIDWGWRYLALGWSSLPATLPRDLLTAWVKGYLPDFGGKDSPVSPQPFVRCEHCYLVHPNRDADGSWGRPSRCAACAGTDLSQQQLYDMRLFSRDGGRSRFAADGWCRPASA